MQKISYVGDGSTTEFTFNFPYYETTDVVVRKNNTIATDYTIVGTSGGEDADIPFIGGKVVFTTAPTALDTITIQRHLPLDRGVDYQPSAKINPTTLNQDMNYTIEVLKDMQDNLDEFDSKYEQIVNKDDTQNLLTKINTVSQQITNLGDVSTIRSNITSLQSSVSDLTTTTGTHTSDISTLNSRTSGMIDYVIETQAPTADNNYTWYRKYKSGWVEQGGISSTSSITAGDAKSVSITYPIEMVNTNYIIMSTLVSGDYGSMKITRNKTGGSITMFNRSSSGTYNYQAMWFVSGFCN